MIHKILLEKTYYIFFSNVPKPWNEKSSNHKCFKYLNKIYFECPINLPLPWEDGFYDTLTEYCKEKRAHNHYYNALYNCLSDAEGYALQDERLILALGIKFYLDRWAGTHGHWCPPKNASYIVTGYEKVRMYALRTKPITLHNILYNFYEFLFPGCGKYANEVNYKNAQVYLRRKYERTLHIKEYSERIRHKEFIRKYGLKLAHFAISNL